MIELIFFPKLSPDDVNNMVTIEGGGVLDSALKRGKGAVLVAAHFGNWELIGAAVAQHYPITFIIGQQSNRLTDDLLNSYRARQGMRMVPLKVALRGVTRVLKNNEFVALVSDQDAHEKGTFVDFFGRPASTPKGPALFALRFGSPIIASTMIRENGRFRAVFEEVPRPAPTGDEEKDIQNYTAAYTKVLEKYIRMYPDHWFWMHKRWKTRPSL
jgi:KDO2-lipid IV(A) lauroyltransferase